MKNTYTKNHPLLQAATSGAATNASVRQDEGVLLPPSVDEASGAYLGVDAGTVTLRIPPWANMAERDLLTYYWLGNPGKVQLSDGLHVPAALVGQDVTFILDPKNAVAPFDGGTVEAWYQVTPADGSAVQTSRHASWQVADTASLPAPVVVEADEGEINPETVEGSLHVRINYPGMVDGDTLQVVWRGYLADGSAGDEYRPPLHVVTENEATDQTILVPVPVTELDPYQNGQVVVSYILVRYGSSSESASLLAEYAVVTLSGGNLWVVGGRNNSLSFLNQGTAPLVALTRDGRQPQEAQWQYEGDAESVTGERFADPWPMRVLTVRRGQDVVRLRPANLAGGDGAATARLDDGALVAWGNADYGGSVPDDIGALRDIVALTGNLYSFTALRQNGSVVAWGDVDNGGSVPDDIGKLRDIVAVTGNGIDFTALRQNGSLVAWGSVSVPDDIGKLRDIVAVTENLYSFAALRQNGSVVAWGSDIFGGSVPDDIGALRDIVAVTGDIYAFAALRQDGSVVAWGDTDSSGSVPDDIRALKDIVAITGSSGAFAALRQNGSVVAWGNANYGGRVPDDIGALKDIVAITGSVGAFAALRQDGSVVAWGDVDYAGSVPDDIGTLRDIVAITGSGGAFAALRQDGSVVAWGNANYGGRVPDNISALRNIRAVYAAAGMFIALTEANTVYSWGVAALPPAPPEIQGHISYQLPERTRLRQLTDGGKSSS